MLLGSVSTQLIRRAECPVVIVPDRGVEPTEESLPSAGGVVESWDANAWAGLIERFGRRNAGRPTQLRFKTASPQGAGSIEQGYRLVDATFDRAAARAEIVLADPDSASSQLSHRISNVRAVMVSTDAMGRDTSLRLDTASGTVHGHVGREASAGAECGLSATVIVRRRNRRARPCPSSPTSRSTLKRSRGGSSASR